MLMVVREAGESPAVGQDPLGIFDGVESGSALDMGCAW
jgi:hypothetical protein